MTIRIHGGRVIDPGRLDGIFDILVDRGRIVDILPGQPSFSESVSTLEGGAERIIDAVGLIVIPGLIDLHVHFREPGQEHKETLETGMAAAARGGFIAVCTMPNTRPAADSKDTLGFIVNKSLEVGRVRVFPVGAVTRGLGGQTLCDYAELKAAGAVAVSDDGMPVMNSLLMRQALERANALDLLMISHSEDLLLAAGGAMNEGEISRMMGVKGIPAAAETIGVMRDIALAELTGARLHIAHVSAEGSVRAVREAKERGIRVTAETAPHYMTLTEKDVLKYGTHAKMNPPLRTARDREAVRRGLADGTIDAVATDHAPHTREEKARDFAKAPNGIIGLETALPVSLGLVWDQVMTLPELIEKMSVNPARILGIDNRLTKGNSADLTVIDPHATYRIDAGKFRSKARNTPFDGWAVKGRVVLTMVGGEVVFEEGRQKTEGGAVNFSVE